MALVNSLSYGEETDSDDICIHPGATRTTITTLLILLPSSYWSSRCFNRSNKFLLIVFKSGLSDIVIEQKDSYKDLPFASTVYRTILSSVYAIRSVRVS